MKKLKYLVIAASAVTLAAVLAPDSAHAQAAMAGTSHDLSAIDVTSGEICIFCHTPHNASATARPLWNRTLSSLTFDMYDNAFSTTIDSAQATAPEGVSAACLSCHDGATAYESLLNPGTVPAGTTTMSGNRAVGRASPGPNGNLTDDHPISIALDNADGGFNTPTAGKIGVLPVYQGTNADQVECGTCHDPHTPLGGNANMLRVVNTGSALCITCHLK